MRDNQKGGDALALCEDKLVRALYYRSNWRHRDLRMAWAIAMRESSGVPGLVKGDDYGLFQLNERGWGATEYWPDNPLDGKQNTEAANLIWEDHGWVPWGHNSDGSTNDSHYKGKWTTEEIRAWITVPFREKYRSFPDSCKPWLRLD